MIRVTFTTNYQQYKKGQKVELTPNEAFGLIDKGVAKVTKDITKRDIKTK